jgi:hypothetical protein
LPGWAFFQVAQNHPFEYSACVSVHVTMTQKPILLVTVAMLCAGLLLYVNRDWFKRRPIQISHRFHAFGGRFDRAGQAPLLFEFDRKLKLTSVKVIPLAGLQTNKFPHPIWQMVSDSNSVPTRGFLYGGAVPGMRPALKGAVADRLDPAQKYRLLLEAGSAKAEHDFSLDPTAQ